MLYRVPAPLRSSASRITREVMPRATPVSSTVVARRCRHRHHTPRASPGRRRPSRRGRAAPWPDPAGAGRPPCASRRPRTRRARGTARALPGAGAAAPPSSPRPRSGRRTTFPRRTRPRMRPNARSSPSPGSRSVRRAAPAAQRSRAGSVLRSPLVGWSSAVAIGSSSCFGPAAPSLPRPTVATPASRGGCR